MATDSFDSRDQVIAQNKAEYGDNYARLAWPDETAAREWSRLRSDLLTRNAAGISLVNRGSKPYYLALSPGCRLCTQGEWSCLFISGKCNCRCFYCPSKQDEVGTPGTNSLSFNRARDYADYVSFFRFRGMSISGGEPLLTFTRTLEFVHKIKARFGASVHLWLYTNGTLLDDEKLKRLRDCGLDEMRFDLGAVNYSLNKVRSARSFIPFITVEIPAIPEDEQILKAKLVEMEEAGVDYLNLHQLRLTPYNFEKVARRPYTFLHGEKVTVLESEITALRVLQSAAERHSALPVNYCSFVYKDRYQKAAARRRCAQGIRMPHEDVTESGYIRTLSTPWESDRMGDLTGALRAAGFDEPLWHVGRSRDRLSFSSRVLPVLQERVASLFVDYSDAVMLPAVSYRNVFKEIRLNPGKKIFLERYPVCRGIEIQKADFGGFKSVIGGAGPPARMDAKWRELERHERIPSGLQEYF